jgi:hypothetical protein
MANLPVRVADRLTAGIKRFQPILAAAKARDVNESDTVILERFSCRRSDAIAAVADVVAALAGREEAQGRRQQRAGPPLATGGGDVRAALFVGVYRFF